jgi:phage terminase large subunit
VTKSEEIVTFTLSPKQSEALKALQDNQTTEIFYGGGAGSGKSYFGCYWQIKQRLQYPKTRGMIGRVELKSLKESTLVTFFKVCSILKLEAGKHYKYNAQDHTITWYNGSKTVLQELAYYPSDPDFQRFGSTEYTDVFIDEASEISEKAFDIINSRIRWMIADYNLTPKILITGNAGDHWIKNKYIKDSKGKPVELKKYQRVIRGTVKDNIDKNFATNYESQLEKISSTYDRLRLLNDDWDIMPRTGREYYFSFVPSKHICRFEYNPDEPLHISLDFNVNPYMTMLVSQIIYEGDKFVIRFLDEFCLTHPLNKTSSVCKAFKKKYGDELKHRAGVFYYGDSTSQKRNTMSDEQYEHDFSIVESELFGMLTNGSDRVINNPPVLKRRDFILNILEEKLKLKVEISENCTELIKDLLYLKQGADGKKFKELMRDPITNATYQKYGHTSDAMEYIICSAFYDVMEANSRK